MLTLSSLTMLLVKWLALLDDNFCKLNSKSCYLLVRAKTKSHIKFHSRSQRISEKNNSILFCAMLYYRGSTIWMVLWVSYFQDLAVIQIRRFWYKIEFVKLQTLWYLIQLSFYCINGHHLHEVGTFMELSLKFWNFILSFISFIRAILTFAIKDNSPEYFPLDSNKF